MRGALGGLILVLFTAGSSVAAILAERLHPGGNRAERVMGWWGRAFVRLGGWTFRVEGMENLPSGGAVLVANHQSAVDIPMLLAAFPDVHSGRRDLGTIPGSPPDLRTPPPGCRFHPRCHYAEGVCAEREPELAEIHDQHWAACHFAGHVGLQS